MTMRLKLIISFLTVAMITGCSTLPSGQDTTQEADEVSQAGTGTVAESTPRPRYDSKAEQLFQLGNGQRGKDNTKAIELYESAIKADAAIEPAYFNLARLRLELKQYTELEALMTLAGTNNIQSPRLGLEYGSFAKRQRASLLPVP